MEKLLVPGAIVLAALIVAIPFRYEVQPQGFNSGLIIVRDRWTGETKRCLGEGSVSTCRPFLSAGLRAI